METIDTGKHELHWHKYPDTHWFYNGGFYTITGFLSCDCGEVYKENKDENCPNCGNPDDENPDAMLEECYTMLDQDTLDFLLDALKDDTRYFPMLKKGQ